MEMTLAVNVARSLETRRQFVQLRWDALSALAAERASLKKRLTRVNRDIDAAQDRYDYAVEQLARHRDALKDAQLL